MKIPAKLTDFMVDRLGLDEIFAFAKKKTVPVHKHTFWYYWGGITLFAFIIQVLTGVLLLIYYRPGPDAYESVRQITYDIHFGWLIRSTHNWAANIFLLSAFIHMFSVYFMKAYRQPREFGWWSGVLLLIVGLVFGFSGYLLPMDDLSYFATKIGLEIPNSIPVIGPTIANLFRGGVEVTEYTVQRFFALHAVILPLVFLPLLMFHLYLVQKHGMAVPEAEEEVPVEKRKTMPFFPNFMAKDLAMWLITLNVIAILAALFPWQLGPQADALKPAPAGIHPEWYFMAQFQIMKVMGNVVRGFAGEALGMTLFTLGILLWFIVPLFDMNKQSERRAKIATYFGLLALGVVLIFTIWGYAAVA
ncbi:MAG: cytochrome bc complex cytochrome b subunit [Armatimonadetes bacterium]|nr:cytochrome bc complex cytochrome b subunit [Armatimonadota bacterium]